MNIVISACSYRYLHKSTAFSIAQLSAYLADNSKANGKHRFLTSVRSPDADIARARSQIATNFLLESDADALFFVDDDIVFNPSDAIKLANLCEEKKEIVCGCYVTKSDPPQLASRLFDSQRVEFNREANPVEILYAAGGFTMIHRKVLQKMIDKLFLCFANSKSEMAFYPFFIPMVKRINQKKFILFGKSKNDQWEYLSEDFAFCERARMDGFKIWLDPTIRLAHVGPYHYTLEDLKRFESQKLTNENISVTKVMAV